jgi:hypothetical protein
VPDARLEIIRRKKILTSQIAIIRKKFAINLITSARPFIMIVQAGHSAYWSEKWIAESVRLVLSLRAVRDRGGSASEPRQALIGATVVCPSLPRIPWQHFFA